MINKQLMLVAMLSVGTALTTMGKVKPALASITPPTTYDYSYTWNTTASEQYLNVNGVDSIPLYTRTADGVYWNYTSTFNVIDGLSVIQTFNRSNSTWQASGISWKPDENRIGSDNAVGNVRKFNFKFFNETNRDYALWFDATSTTVTTTYDTYYNNVSYGTYAISTYAPIDGFLKLIIPSQSNLELNLLSSTSQRYFDAWYLKDLGVNAAYQAGLDAETNGILTDYLGTDAQQIGWVLLGIAAILFVMKGGK